jgi:hypothetical protein
VERGRDRFVFAAPLLGGLTPGGSGSDPSTRKRRTDTKLGPFYNEEIYFGSWWSTGCAPTVLRVWAHTRTLILLVLVRLSLDTQFLDDEKRRETKHDDIK